jgi:membrane protease YdiL (CAAX protease family)
MTPELPQTSGVHLHPAGLKQERRPLLGTQLVTLAYLLAFTTKLITRLQLTANELTDPSRLIQQIVWAGILGAMVLGCTLFLDRLPLSSIGIHRLSLSNVFFGVFSFIVGTVLEQLLRPVVVRSGLTVIHIRVWDAPPSLEWSSIVAAVLAEELVFRGYLIERVGMLTGRISTAVMFSCLTFAVWHLPLWGTGEMVLAGSWGIVLAILYVWRRNLPACMLTHFLADALGAGDIRFGGPVRWGPYVGFGIYFRFFPR